MATDITTEISELTARLESLNIKIDKQEQFREVEEGSSTSRFVTQFTDIDKLYNERDRIKTRLRTLEASV